ncbi:hypothetical protein CXF83_03240 [Shewanella sp. Choline-02u-19]|jgi:uncharacterized protein YccT (UPF0319 family)|uniref:DUF2057 family protein n=1 Tax=unclassified Shewanella TaxID=196818 RepID=UPI000C3351A6|nr:MULTISPECIES: DUF2057 family protein [unclassified Shewanella]PKG55675.1 hypothetical protein CXF82_18520 [Shewanella sp. GutDb-MelDb]PKG72778.1 hypothetical protein CXF86_20435 [Shewanella sp. GutCb]PKH57204.1 hypothetical protein CXF84_09515 [Shewanella sp. Bg11-22]PKI29681.1 hypothetical protein CXF83_03240 [Shewanella sp. Choline-02u-19]
MKKFISVIALSLASFTSMAASVSFPESLEVLGVNGLNNVDSRYLQLENGQNLIELQYRDLFESNADDSNWVRSEPLYLYIDLETAANYEAITPSILSEEDAYQFINSPYIKLTDDSGSEKQVALMTHSQLMAKILLQK